MCDATRGSREDSKRGAPGQQGGVVNGVRGFANESNMGCIFQSKDLQRPLNSSTF